VPGDTDIITIHIRLILRLYIDLVKTLLVLIILLPGFVRWQVLPAALCLSTTWKIPTRTT
jgi:hypothetical protein